MQAGNTAFGSSGPAAPAPGQPGSTPAAISGLDAPEIPQQHAPGPQSEPEAPASVGEPVDPLPVGLAKHRKKGLFIGLIVSAIVLLLSGGAAAAYFGYYLPNKPENVLKRALVNSFDLKKAKTIHFSGEITSDEGETSIPLSMTFQGATDTESGAFDVKAELDILLTTLALDARTTDGKTFYFKVGGLDDMAGLLDSMAQADPVSAMDAAILSGYLSVFQGLNEQWVELSRNAAEQLGIAAESEPNMLSVDRQKIVDAYLANEFLIIKEKLADEDIKGVKSHHYKIDIDKAKLKAFAAELSKNISAFKQSEEQRNEFNRIIDEMKLYNLEVWIAKSDKTFRKVAFAYSANGDAVEGHVTVDSYNQPVTVEKPENAKSLLEVIQDLFSSFSGARSLEELLPAELDAQQAGILL